MTENTMETQDLMEQEEEEERRLITTMALVIFVAVAGVVLYLAIRPWIQQLRGEDEALAEDAVDAPSVMDAAPVVDEGAPLEDSDQ